MTVLDSSGWIEFFADGPYAEEFAGRLRHPTSVITPTVAIYEVYKSCEGSRTKCAQLLDHDVQAGLPCRLHGCESIEFRQRVRIRAMIEKEEGDAGLSRQDASDQRSRLELRVGVIDIHSVADVVLDQRHVAVARGLKHLLPVTRGHPSLPVSRTFGKYL